MLRSKFDSHNFLLALESLNLLYVCKTQWYNRIQVGLTNFNDLLFWYKEIKLLLCYV